MLIYLHYNGFNDQVGNVVPYLISIYAFLFQVSPQSCKTPLVALAGILVIVCFVLFVGLVDTVVSQMHEAIVDSFHRVRISFN